MILIWGFRVAKDFDLGIEADTHERERERAGKRKKKNLMGKRQVWSFKFVSFKQYIRASRVLYISI